MRKTIAQETIEERQANGQELLGQTSGWWTFRKGSNLARKLVELGLTEAEVDVRTGARAGRNKNDGYELLIFSVAAAINTKTRHLEIYDAAAKALSNAGGVRVIDDLPLEDRRQQLREMAKLIKEVTGCHIDTAKRNLAKALRRARYKMMQDKEPQPDNWGGHRANSGRPKVAR